jgi:hypothetical protein
VAKQRIAHALAEGVVDHVPLVVKDAIWIPYCLGLQVAYCRMIRSHSCLS